MENQFNIEEKSMERPQGLTILCILSFIGNSFGILLGLIGVLGADKMVEKMQEIANDSELYNLSARDSEQLEFAMSMIMGIGSVVFVIIFSIYLVICLLSLFGAIKMWNLKKSGFWIYSIPNGILSLMYLASANWFMAIIGVLFIVLYGKYLGIIGSTKSVDGH